MARHREVRNMDLNDLEGEDDDEDFGSPGLHPAGRPVPRGADGFSLSQWADGDVPAADAGGYDDGEWGYDGEEEAAPRVSTTKQSGSAKKKKKKQQQQQQQQLQQAGGGRAIVPVTPGKLDLRNNQHLMYLDYIGIRVVTSNNGITLVHQPESNKVSHQLGVAFLQELQAITSRANKAFREPLFIKFDDGKSTMLIPAGGAVFGPNLDLQRMVFGGVAELVQPTHACIPINNNIQGKVAVVMRGNCIFVDKVRIAQNAGAVAVIIIDITPSEDLISMSGDGTDDVRIPSAFVRQLDGHKLLKMMGEGSPVQISLYSSIWATELEN